MTDARYLVYLKADPDYSGRVTVPVLWDKQGNTIVSNESSEIIRMFNSAFDDIGAAPGDDYPEPLRDDIDALNDVIYPNINNGAYRAGFATTQAAYETEADWRLFTTLVRFDAVYVGHLKCNLRRIVEYPNLWGYVRDLYQQPGIGETVKLDHIKKHYHANHGTINPTGVIPIGPEVDFDEPHGRF